ncbi:MAG: hypothetical protein LZF63_12360, partial [Nitrosomonas sp.]|nr:hypothetical protein [Nitrosomonas sp.]
MQKSLNFSVAFFVLIFVLCISPFAMATTGTFHHHMEIQLSPNTSEIRVKDQIRIPDWARDTKEPVQLEFFLHAGLAVTDVQGAAIQADENE